MLRTLCRFLLLWLLAAASALQAEDAWQPTEGWYTLHHDVLRSGRTQDSPGVPFDYVWHKEYWDELIAPEAEPIVAESLVFFGTLKGIVHALDAESGRELWRFKPQRRGGFAASPAV
jgi:outer membrane protein assembly factor BamB